MRRKSTQPKPSRRETARLIELALHLGIAIGWQNARQVVQRAIATLDQNGSRPKKAA
jgi:hypothetical protein